MLILEEHDLDGFIKEYVKEPEGEEAKAKHKKDMIKVKKDNIWLYQGSVDIPSIFKI